MKLNLLILLLFGIFLISGCSENQAQNTNPENKALIDQNTKINTTLGDTKIEVEDSKATVEYSNKTIIANNVSLNVNDEGTYHINLSIQNNLSLPPEIPIEKWCIAGENYEINDPNNKGAKSQAKILGIEKYRNNTYCKSEAKTNIYNMEIMTTYYFNYGAKEIWALVNIGGTINEIHINNN